MSKNYFGLLDSRNTKFQGLIKDDLFAGIGVLIDQTLTFALSTWESSNLNGPSLIIYPNLQMFFGQMQNNKPKDVCCFQLNRNQKLIIDYPNTDLKSSSQKVTFAYVLSQQSVVQVQKNLETNQFKVIQVFYTKNEDQEIQFLSQIFKTEFSNDKIDLPAYLNKNFIQTNNIFELSGRKQVFFGFKDTISLGFKMENNSPTFVGFFKPFPRTLIFGSKTIHNITLPAKTLIEEGYFDPYTKTFNRLIQKEPSLEFQKLSEDYFKKSTTFRNQFVPLDHLARFHKDIKSIAEIVRFEATKKFGQALLENDYGSSHQNEKEVIAKEYTLEEMRQEIYKAAAKRQRNHIDPSKSPIRQLTKKPLEDVYLNSIDSERKYPLTVRKNKQSTLINDSTVIISRRTNENTALIEDKKKGFSYQHSRKQDLIKDVNEIVKIRKQSEEALLKELIKENLKQQKDLSSKKQFNYSDKLEEPFEGSRKYNRYEPKITPFSDFQQLNSKPNLQSSKKREVRYSHLQKTKQEHALLPERGLQEVIKRDRSMNQINTFQLKRQEINTKSHTNLSKYKERHKQPAGYNIEKKQNRHPYKYLEEGQDHFYPNSGNKIEEKMVPQIKLFGDRTQTNKQNDGFVQAERNPRTYRYTDENMTKPSYQQTKSPLKEKYFVASRPLGDKSFNQREYQANVKQRSKLKKDYSRQINLNRAKHDNHNPIEANKKLKRTYHYVD